MAMQLYRPSDALAEKSTFEIMPLAFQLAEKLSPTEFVPAGLRNRPAAVAAAILTGHEVGLPPMAALAHIHVIEGRPGMSAAAQRALVLAHGHKIWVEESTNTRAVVCSQRRGEDRISTTSWTMDDAAKAKLAHKDNWQKYPRNMLVARATGDNCRGNFMDVLAGLPYNTEELADLEAPEPPGDGSAPSTPGLTRRRRAQRAATAPAADAPPPGPDPAPVEESAAASVIDHEPPPAPEPDAVPADEPTPADENVQYPNAPATLPPAGEAAPGEQLTLAQRVAIACREAAIDRQILIQAVTGKERARDLSRQEAVDVLEKAKQIGRGEARLVLHEGVWNVVAANPGEQPLPFGEGR